MINYYIHKGLQLESIARKRIDGTHTQKTFPDKIIIKKHVVGKNQRIFRFAQILKRIIDINYF